ncbi:tape measure protein [Pseudomonas luteola]|uniref:tape measure protein n=1 Tax=Pseudomonas luteola TaxID=47886 RepID=UPI003A897C11
MAKSNEIASYHASVGFKLDTSSMRRIDAVFRQMEQRMAAFKKKWEQSVSISNFKFDSLKFQKAAQQAINKSQKLLQVEVSNFRIDTARLHSQLQRSFDRASQNVKINVKTIAGQSGGTGVRPVFIQPHPQGGQAFGVGGIGSTALMGASRFGIPGLAAAGAGAGLMALNSKMNEVQDRVSNYEMQRLQLGASVGGTAERRRNNIVALREISDMLGTSAEAQVGGYTKLQKQLQGSGLTARQSIGLYKNLAVSTRGNGGDTQSIERQAYALQQTFGLGYLRGEELNTQLADANPAIKKFIQQAHLQRIGFKGTESQGTQKFMDDLGKRLVSTADVMRGYELSAQDAATRVAELSNSIEGANARLENTKWFENLERADGDLTDAIRDRIEAEKELYEASKPLRDAFNSTAAAAIKLTASFLKWLPEGARTLVDNPPSSYGLSSTDNVFQDQVKGSQLYGGSASNAGGWLYNLTNRVSPSLAYDLAGSSLDRFRLQAPADFKDYQAQAQQTAMQTMTNSVDNRTFRTGDTTFANGAIQVNVAQGDPETIVSGMETQLTELVKRVNTNTLSEASINYPRTGR